MSDSSEDDSNPSSQWVFYKDRPEWADVKPVPQEDGEFPVVSISYSPKFKDVYDYLRGLMKVGEKSKRAIELTKDAIALNPANYTVWQYRRDVLKSLDSDLRAELSYVEGIIWKHQKNYQVWHHRRVVVEWLNDATAELDFTQEILASDCKNYHAWQHRQWAIKTYNLFQGELEYIDLLLQDDIRNNSAWNQRFFVLNNTTGFTEETIAAEVDYTLSKIEIAKENESAWNYLRGLLLHHKGGLSNNKKVTDFCEDLYEGGDRSPFLLALIVDMCDEQVTNGEDCSGDTRYTLNRAKKLCHELAVNYDQIRCKYWEYMASVIEKKATGEAVEDEKIDSVTRSENDDV